MKDKIAPKLIDWIQTLQVIDPIRIGGLIVFGIRSPGTNGQRYELLHVALAEGYVRISEVSEAGSVPDIVIENNGPLPVLLIAGAELVGAKQNRVLNTSVMVPPYSKRIFPVSCVERGRWGYRSRWFSSVRSASHAKLRMRMAKDVHDSYKMKRRPIANQGAVWTEVDSVMEKRGSRSSTRALHQMYEDHRIHLDDVVRKVSTALPEDCVGVVFAVSDQIVGADVFDKAGTLRQLLPELVKSTAIHAMDTTNDRNKIDKSTVKDWLDQLSNANFESFPSPGVGDDVRITDSNLTGACLMVDESPVHLQLFNELMSYGESTKRGRDQVPRSHARGSQRVAVIPTSSPFVEAAQLAANLLRSSMMRMGVSLSVSSSLLIEEDPASEFERPGILSHEEERRIVRRAREQVPSANLRVVLTSKGLADNWFTHWHDNERTAVVSLYQWESISSIRPMAFVASTVLLQSLRLMSPRFLPNELFHDDTRGCLFDFCGNKRDIDVKLRSGDICPDCRRRMVRMGIGIDRIRSALESIRQIAVRSEGGRQRKRGGRPF